jgi:hypothetical protein
VLFQPVGPKHYLLSVPKEQLLAEMVALVEAAIVLENQPMAVMVI